MTTEPPPSTEPDGAPDGGVPAGPLESAAPTAEELARAREGHVRRAPRYRAFVQAGVVVGVLVGVVLTLALPSEPTEAGRGVVALFVGLTGAVIGALAGAVVAVLVDRRSARR